MKAVYAGIAALVAGQGAIAAQLEPSLVGKSEQEPQVIAFYDRQCGQYADNRGLTGEQRAAYLAQCKQNAPGIWPVGPDNSDD